MSPATLPALRTLKRLPSATSNTFSGFTRESAQDRMAANGHWPFTSSRPLVVWSIRWGFPATQRALPSRSKRSASVGVIVVPSVCVAPLAAGAKEAMPARLAAPMVVTRKPLRDIK